MGNNENPTFTVNGVTWCLQCSGVVWCEPDGVVILLRGNVVLLIVVNFNRFKDEVNQLKPSQSKHVNIGGAHCQYCDKICPTRHALLMHTARQHQPLVSGP